MENYRSLVALELAPVDRNIVQAAARYWDAWPASCRPAITAENFEEFVRTYWHPAVHWPYEVMPVMQWGDRRMAMAMATLQKIHPEQMFFTFLFRIGYGWFACQASSGQFAIDVASIIREDHPGSTPVSWDPDVAAATIDNLMELNYDLDGVCTASIEGCCVIQVITRITP